MKNYAILRDAIEEKVFGLVIEQDGGFLFTVPTIEQKSGPIGQTQHHSSPCKKHFRLASLPMISAYW